MYPYTSYLPQGNIDARYPEFLIPARRTLEYVHFCRPMSVVVFWHSLFVALLPSTVAVAILIRYRSEIRENWLIFLLAIAFSFVQGRPEIQGIYALHGRSFEGVFAHAAPFFIILYIFFGRFLLPSVPLAWAGTYICLMVTDISANYFQWRIGPYDLPVLLSGIGGAGWLDGLIWLPIGAAAITAFARYRLIRGHTFKSMVGRKIYMQDSLK